MQPVRQRLNSGDYSLYLPTYERKEPENKISCLSHSILIEKENESSEDESQKIKETKK